jgi:hypothetical protein
MSDLVDRQTSSQNWAVDVVGVLGSFGVIHVGVSPSPLVFPLRRRWEPLAGSVGAS